MTGPPLQRLLASLAIGVVLVGAYWLAMESIPVAMLAEADAAGKFFMAGGKVIPHDQPSSHQITQRR